MRTGPLRLGRGLRALLQGVPGLLGQHRASREEERAHRAHRHLRKFLSIVLLLIFTTNETLKLHRVASKVRSDDYMRIRERINMLAGIADTNNELANKANRGWNNEGTSAQLVPLARLKEFERDPARYVTHPHCYSF